MSNEKDQEEKTALRDDEEDRKGDAMADGSVVGGMPDDFEHDSSKVQFINGGAGPVVETRVDFNGDTQVGDFVGLSKEELLKYTKDPYWVKVRWVLLILFWITWVAMLAAAIAIIVVAPKCPPRPKLDWWQTSTFYQIYPSSFKDTDGDGIGDIKGIHEKLDYLYEQNVTSLWINPIYSSPMKDMGYDITDHTAIDPRFGTMADFDNLRIAMHKKEMKLIMDFIPNHTSKNHTWFQQSKMGKGKYRDFYVWHPGTDTGAGRAPPNNWLSVFGGSAWTFDDNRKEYYLHQFLSEQPDLNLSNPEVQEELKKILLFWLEKGVDGFRIDAVKHLFETANLTQNEPLSGNDVDKDNYGYLEHTLTTFQPECYEIMTTWRELVDEYSTTHDGKPRFIIAEVYGSWNKTEPFYHYNNKPGAHMPYNMNLIKLKSGCNSLCVHELVNDWVQNMNENYWPNWVLGNHDNSRIASRLGQEYVNPANMLLLTLPGTPTVYYGEEIGMHDVHITFEDTKDLSAKKLGSEKYINVTRDPERTPMQWSSEKNAGFSTGDSTWLPVAPDYKQRNVKTQHAAGLGETNIEVFHNLTVLRKEPSFQWGEMHYAVLNEEIFSYVRQAQGFPGYLVAMNFGNIDVNADFVNAASKHVPRYGKIVTTTGELHDDFRVGTTVDLSNIFLEKGKGLIFEWEVAPTPE